MTHDLACAACLCRPAAMELSFLQGVDRFEPHSFIQFFDFMLLGPCCHWTSFASLIDVFLMSSGYVSCILIIMPSSTLRTSQLGTATPRSLISQKKLLVLPVFFVCFSHLGLPFSHPHCLRQKHGPAHASSCSTSRLCIPRKSGRRLHS